MAPITKEFSSYIDDLEEQNNKTEERQKASESYIEIYECRKGRVPLDLHICGYQEDDDDKVRQSIGELLDSSNTVYPYFEIDYSRPFKTPKAIGFLVSFPIGNIKVEGLDDIFRWIPEPKTEKDYKEHLKFLREWGKRKKIPCPGLIYQDSETEESKVLIHVDLDLNDPIVTKSARRAIDILIEYEKFKEEQKK